MKKKIAYTILAVVPTITFAFSLEQSTFKGIIWYILDIIGLLTPILFGAAFVVFFWGLSKFILHSDNQKDIENGRNYMLWGILALFILISFRAIVGFIANDLEIGNDPYHIPIFPKVEPK